MNSENSWFQAWFEPILTIVTGEAYWEDPRGLCPADGCIGAAVIISAEEIFILILITFSLMGRGLEFAVSCEVFFLANWIKKRLDYRLRWRKSVVATMVATVEHWTLLQLQWTVYDCGAFTLFSATLCVIWIGKTRRGAYAAEEYKTMRGAVQQLVIWAGFFTPTCSGSLAWRSDYEAVPNKPGYTKATWFNFFECLHIDLAGTVPRGFVQAKRFPIIFA